MYKKIAAVMVALAGATLTGCGGQDAATSAPAQPGTTAGNQAPASQPNYDIPMTNFAPLKIGNYDVQPMFEEVIENGHYNIKITGGEVAAVRIWVGPEDASGVMVVKTEIENDYNHGHVEVPKPIPADARLWIEIETPTGEKLKGSTPLKAA